MVGSPAPAGIDPNRMTPGKPNTRLPRTRGDRPNSIEQAVTSLMAPPHPRGSTLVAAGRGRDARGSPAPAGIDPSGASRTMSCSGLPRTRGDRPDHDPVIAGRHAAPPHPRGSTLNKNLAVLSGAGSPAPAGIDPRARLLARGGGRLPRTRGDRPGLFVLQCAPKEAPPHPRGSTRPRPQVNTVRKGSPAPAGIDPRAA